jgi:hypothetical protein
MLDSNKLADGAATVAGWAVYSPGGSMLFASLMEPWKFRMDLIQQSGRDESTGMVLALAGQQA